MTKKTKQTFANLKSAPQIQWIQPWSPIVHAAKYDNEIGDT